MSMLGGIVYFMLYVMPQGHYLGHHIKHNCRHLIKASTLKNIIFTVVVINIKITNNKDLGTLACEHC